MGWAILQDSNTQAWFDVFQSVRSYMFIMRTTPEKTYNEKIKEALSTYDTFCCFPERKKKIRYVFETIEMIKDRVLDRKVYDLNYH